MSKYTIKFGDKEVEASPYQCEIFDNVEHGVGNMIIEAAAGAAKTTTIVNCMRFIPENKSILFIAFNKDIVKAIKEKVGERKNTRISTFHSLGLAIFMENNKKNSDSININEYKYKQYIKKNINDLTDYKEIKSLGSNKNTYINNINNLVEYSRYYLAFTEKQIKHVADKYGILCVRDEVKVCRKILKWGEDNIDTIDYTDMIWLPNVLNYNTKKYRYNWVMIDEAQDVTIAEEKLIEKTFKRGCRVIIIGDRFQTINIWAGSDEEAIDNFAKMPQTKHFTLPISYRCPKNIVNLAKKYSDNIVTADNAIDGKVKFNVSKNLPTNGDMVLCRITAPLIDLHLHYMRINKKSYIRGYENIKERYLNLVNATGSLTLDKDFNTVDGFFPSLYKMLLEQIDQVKKEFNLDDADALMFPSILSLYDSIQGLKVMSEGITKVDELIDRINTVFSGNDKDAIQLSTVHKAKGLEADNVYILFPSLMPIKFAKKDWELKTENNLIYVAITRAKKTLNYIKEDNNDKAKIFSKSSIKTELDRIRKSINYISNIGIKEYKGGELNVGLKKLNVLGKRSKSSQPPKKKKPMSKFQKIINNK